MTLLYRLRRSVALFICPEMGVEARLRAMRTGQLSRKVGFSDLGAAKSLAALKMTERETLLVLARIYGSDDSWAELLLWLKERSVVNQGLGGPEGGIIALVVMWVAQLSFLAGPGGQK